MANNTEVLIIDGVEYTLIDSTAVHTVDSGLSTSSSNPVRNSVITSEVNKKPTLLKFGPYTATLTGEYYTFPFPYVDIGGIAASHDGIAISFSSSSAFRPNSTLIAFKNEASLLNGVNVNAYSGTLSDATTIDSNTFVCILPTSGTSSGGTGYVKPAQKIADAINALDATISGLGTGKTITALSETNGIISATASNIAIAGSQVTSGTIAEARLPYSYVKKSGDTMTGDLIVPAERIANTYYGITFGRTTSTPVETILYTGIKWVSGSHMPVIHITGYAYGLQSPVEFKIGFYIFGKKIGWQGATNMGSWNPSIYLFKYTRDSVDYVAVGLAGSCYYLQLQADVQDEMGKFANIVTDSSAWSWSFLTETGTIPAVDDGSTCAKVPYKADILEAKIHNQWYGTCATAAGTAAKVVTCTGFVLVAGARISVKFTNGSTSTATMQLNVNSTGAKNCGVYLYNGTWQTYANRCEKNTVLEFVYDGTYWVTITPYALRNYAGYNSRLTSANVSLADFGLQYFLATSAMVTGKPPVDAAILNMNWDNGTIWGHQLAVGNGTGRVFTRAQNGSATWGDWKELPRLSSTPTDGQIIVYDAQSGNGMLKGGPALDATDTTKFLRHDGSWAEVGGGVAPVEDSDVFLSRAVNFGENKYKFPSLVGGTVAWNQLFDPKASLTYLGVTITKASDGKLTMSGTATGSGGRNNAWNATNTSLIKDHIYYFGSFINLYVQNGLTLLTSFTKNSITKWSLDTVIGTIQFGYNVTQGTTYSDSGYIQLIDLTLALSPTIADYIYSLETSTAGAGVKWFKQYFSKSFYPHNAGALISVNPTGAETVGVNQWNEEWEYGEINSTTGANNGSATTAWRTKNYIPVIPGGTYYVTAPVTNKNLKARFYDASKNYIGYTNKAGTNCFTTTAFTVPDNASYVRFGPAVSDIAVPNNNICVSISNPLYNGTYYPYTHHSYPISPVELRGILKLDANNKMYCDGDVRASDGTVTRKYGIVDLGTLTYAIGATSESGVYRMQTTGLASLIKPPSGSGVVANIVCATYPTMSLDAVYSKNIGIGVSAAGAVAVYDPNYNASSSPSAFKTAMSGVYLVYELATPTTESSAALPVPQVVYDGGIESYIDERDVQMPVGQDATYMDATSAIGELMASGLVPSSGGVSQTSGTFVLGGTGTTITSQWNYVKTGKEVTIYGGFANFMSSSSMTTFFGLPFTPAYSTPVHLSCYVLNVGKFDVVMRLNTDKTMTVECATLTGTNGTVTYLSVPSSTFAYYLIYLSAEIRYITNE